MIQTGCRRLALALALILVTAWVSSCGSSSQPGSETLEFVAVQRGSLVSSITAVGSVRARAEVVLSFAAAGRVSEVAVTSGQRVEAGQVLAALDKRDLELQVRSAEAALSATQARLAQLEGGPRAEQLSAAEGRLAAAQAALDQATAQRDQLLAGATQARIAAAQAAVKSARAHYDRVKAGPTAAELAGAQAALDGAQAVVDQAQAAYDQVRDRPDVGALPQSLALQTATIELRRAQAAYDALVAHPTADELAAAAAQVAQAEAQLAELQAAAAPQLQVAAAAVAAALAQRQIAQADLDLLRAGAASAEVAAAEAQVQQAQVGVDSARLALDRATLTAPFAGVLARVEITVGGSVAPQTPAVTLLGDSQFSIEADVDEADVGWIKLGQTVQITFDAFPEREQAGTVAAIAPLATVDVGIVSYRVTIETGASDLPLRAGMTANVEIVRQSREDVLLVPNLAISVDAGTGLKYVDRKAAAGGLEQVEIATGLTTDQYSEVLSGLAEGDSVAVGSLSAREQFRELMDSTLSGNE